MSDLISRQAAIEALSNHYEVGNQAQNETVCDCVNIIRELPSAEKHGTWIDEFCAYQCSVCHCHIDEETFDDYRKPNYCPNCGARMERSEE